MPQAAQKYDFNIQELITAIIKHKKIHEGIWGLEVRFSWNAVNFEYGNGVVMPTSLVGVQGFALGRVPAVTPISVDAGVCNPSSVIYAPFENR